MSFTAITILDTRYPIPDPVQPSALLSRSVDPDPDPDPDLPAGGGNPEAVRYASVRRPKGWSQPPTEGRR